ncbi:MAG: DMT family transporter [Gammaproteobacteria bacterium]|nr:DMT family transporter [Gammaproteobacteria bacterium]
MFIPWYVAALGAAITWGIYYPLVDMALKRISLYSIILLSMIPVLLVMPLFLKTVSNDIETVKTLPASEQWIIVSLGLIGLFGEVMVYLAISAKNATLASLIEMTYPVFVVLFAYLFYRQMHVTASVFVGGLMIFVGAGLIIYNNQ